jgi:hypothetical protein
MLLHLSITTTYSFPYYFPPFIPFIYYFTLWGGNVTCSHTWSIPNLSMYTHMLYCLLYVRTHLYYMLVYKLIVIMVLLLFITIHFHTSNFLTSWLKCELILPLLMLLSCIYFTYM